MQTFAETGTHPPRPPEVFAYVKALTGSPYVDLKSGLKDTTPQPDSAYLAWEAVRKERAAELVEEVRTPEGNIMPYTGFEGYFPNKTPAQIVAIEIDLGKYILRAIHNYSAYEAVVSGITEHHLRQALRGERFPSVYAGEIVRFYDTLFRTTLARVRGITSPQDYADFQKITYSKVNSGSTFGPRKTGQSSPIVLTNHQDVEAYTVLSDIGIFGHPLLKDAYKVFAVVKKNDSDSAPSKSGSA